MADNTELEFKVQNDEGKWRAPKWKEVTVINADCPKCGQLMMVFTGETMYALCPRCHQYYLGIR